ncbi:MAG: IS3 family transposase [Chitinophagaceae bacterium]
MYSYLDISKQSVHQQIQRDREAVDLGSKFIEKARQIRKDHPALGCRKLALKLLTPQMGRDKIEGLLLQSGFRIVYPPNYTKTTHSVRCSPYLNLIQGLKVNGINQVVQTDITYLWVKDKFYYVVLIIDVYSRRIVGYQASNNMKADANTEALRMMIKQRGKKNVTEMIHHSDKGSQYHAALYLKLLKDHHIKVSMCKEAWENAYTERLNRTVKDEYLKLRQLSGLDDLKRELARTVKLYNQDRPHWSLPKQASPVDFEKAIAKMSPAERPVLTLYNSETVGRVILTTQGVRNKEAAPRSVKGAVAASFKLD